MTASTDSVIPVIAIDGPSGSGKGTISQIVAHRLGWHYLDSGALYRVLALAASRHSLDLEAEDELVTLASHVDVRFVPESGEQPAIVLLEGEDVTDAIRAEECGVDASRVAAFPRVRAAMLGRQQAFRTKPGLVADGRDMGTVVFPDAELKIYLTASQEERAKRRYNQLKQKGIDANLPNLLEDLADRDARDSSRGAAPMKPAEDAVILDTTAIPIDGVVDLVMKMVKDRLVSSDKSE